VVEKTFWVGVIDHGKDQNGFGPKPTVIAAWDLEGLKTETEERSINSWLISELQGYDVKPREVRAHSPQHATELFASITGCWRLVDTSTLYNVL